MPRLFVLMTLLAALCCSCNCPKQVSIHAIGSEDLNQNSAGLPTNARAWVYLLRKNDKFDSASWDEIIDNAEEALGDDLLGTTQIAVHKLVGGDERPEPQVFEIQVESPPCPGFVGILGNFLKKGDGPQKVSVPLKQAGGKLFTFSGYQISVDDN